MKEFDILRGSKHTMTSYIFSGVKTTTPEDLPPRSAEEAMVMLMLEAVKGHFSLRRLRVMTPDRGRYVNSRCQL